MFTHAIANFQCSQEVLSTPEGKDEVMIALIKIADVLGLDPAWKPKLSGDGWIGYPVAPAELHAAMDKAVPDWRERMLFYIP